MKKQITILLFCASVLAQAPLTPLKQSRIQITDRSSSTVVRQELISGTHVINNVSGARRISSVSGGGTSTACGIFSTLTGAAGSETEVNRFDCNGLTSIGVFGNAIRGLESYLQVTDGRQVVASISNNPASPAADAWARSIWYHYSGATATSIAEVGHNSLTSSGELKLSGTGFSLTANASVFDLVGPEYRHNGLSGATSVGVCGVGQVPVPQQMSGGLTTQMTCETPVSGAAYVTLATAQTITADKIVKGVLTIEDSLASVDRITIAPAAITMRNTADMTRVFLSSSSATSGSTGIVRVSTGAAGFESTVAELSANGVTATNFYTVSGLQLFNSSGTCVSCTIPWARITGAPSASGDMLLGTEQTVTAAKNFQMSLGGDAIRIRNSFTQTKGAWNETQLLVGDVAGGSGRGVSIVGNSGVIIYNLSGAVVFQANTSGGISIYDPSLGVARSALTVTCSVGQTVRQPAYVAGFLVSGGCGI